ncbi:MAG TPA: sigma factor-like helix-turn-helix DNA-binding protein [Labilithrix sp.]|nr:sigma factor-like helix-turn-helix DNA-binding protein [Labilithrix sp.]
MEGMSIPEVARTLGIPVGTASSRLRAARSSLAAALEKMREPS